MVSPSPPSVSDCLPTKTVFILVLINDREGERDREGGSLINSN